MKSQEIIINTGWLWFPIQMIANAITFQHVPFDSGPGKKAPGPRHVPASATVFPTRVPQASGASLNLCGQGGHRRSGASLTARCPHEALSVDDLNDLNGLNDFTWF